ncbi:hypothetical protein FLJC2902T_11440 [Flavobacterium limnosediminis JC2902]|uniref:DUF2135 domain-containing protein n=1 Tax=Flavobacterium limnosediminis JC2902 TaxID=1341181 RepID=V6SXH0_9FLAO|nr:hypothetical protein [Flavobacterium limnosediminis]ESU29105.1 hypothetical protein FLJC2902T_11440 [Flavobacterium limnosediminis JC2902]
MKTALKKTILFCILSVGILGCSKDDSSDSSTTNDFVTDAASLMSKMTISGATIKNGEIPVPDGVHTDNIESMPSTVIVTSNSLFAMPITTNITDGRIPRMIFIKLDGSDKYYQINLDSNGDPIPTNRTSPTRHDISCSGAPNIRLQAQPAGGTTPYINDAQVYTYAPPVQADPQDLSFLSDPRYWSAPRPIRFRVLDVGTGDVQISMTWDTQSDVDLWLIEPDGNKIYYADKTSSSGGELDFDNTVEYGPENIFFNTTAPSGTYTVKVNYFSGAPTTTHYNVVVKNGSTITNYEGTLTVDDQTDTVTTFTK